MTALVLSSPPMLRRLSRRLAALLLTAALATAGMIAASAPARAQSGEDLVRFLLGAAAVAVIIRSIDSNATVRYIDRRTLPRECLETVRMRGRQVDVFHSGCLRRAGYRGLPDRCEVSFRTNRGHRTGYEARCMQRSGYSVSRGGGQRPHQGRPGDRLSVLPAQCAMTYRQSGRRHEGYWGSCLRSSGLRRLPQNCVVTRHGGDTVYSARCLRNAGFQTRRR